jgi:hypothetical protein
MQPLTESNTRTATDYVHFALTFFGDLIAIAGVVTTTVWAAVLGLVMIAIGVGYFLLDSY